MIVKNKMRVPGASGLSLKAIGRRIRETRGFDLTQKDFARQLQISQSQLSKYERGLLAPAGDVLVRLKERVGVSIDWVLTGKR